VLLERKGKFTWVFTNIWEHTSAVSLSIAMVFHFAFSFDHIVA